MNVNKTYLLIPPSGEKEFKKIFQRTQEQDRWQLCFDIESQTELFAQTIREK